MAQKCFCYLVSNTFSARSSPVEGLMGTCRNKGDEMDGTKLHKCRNNEGHGNCYQKTYNAQGNRHLN